MTTYNPTSRNTTNYDEALATGRITYLTTDTPDYILVGSAEDEVLILWGDTDYGSVSRNTTSFSASTRNTTSLSAGTRNTTSFTPGTRN